MSYYICHRCNHKTKQKNDMKKHLNRIKKCEKNINAIFLSDDDLVELSLKKINPNINLEKNNFLACTQNSPICTQIKKNDSPFAHKCTQIKKNFLKTSTLPPFFAHKLHTTFVEIENNENENIIDKDINKDDFDFFSCEFCNRSFTRNSSLKRHQLKFCSKTGNININNITNNISNTNNTINNILNINFNIDNKNHNIIPFDEDWDISKIDNETKQLLLMSSIKYTKTMEKILENDVNLNILIEKEKNLGIVYKNDTEKFKEMNINDIINSSMKKLYKHLQQFYDEMKEDNQYKICSDYLDNEKIIIDNKYDEYQNNHKTQQIVQNHLIDIYDKNKEKTLNNYKNILGNDHLLIDKIEGF
jgi:hypothetical protein